MPPKKDLQCFTKQKKDGGKYVTCVEGQKQAQSKEKKPIKFKVVKKEEPKPKKKPIKFKVVEKTFTPNTQYPKIFKVLYEKVAESGLFRNTKYSSVQKEFIHSDFGRTDKRITPKKNPITPIINEYIRIVEKTSLGKKILNTAEKDLPLAPFTDNSFVETLNQVFGKYINSSPSNPDLNNLKPDLFKAGPKAIREKFEERESIIERARERRNIVERQKHLFGYDRSRPTQREVDRSVNNDREYQVVASWLSGMYGNYLRNKPRYY